MDPKKELQKIAKDTLPLNMRNIFCEFFELRFLRNYVEGNYFSKSYAQEWANRFIDKDRLIQVCDELSFSIINELMDIYLIIPDDEELITSIKFNWQMEDNNIKKLKDGNYICVKPDYFSFKSNEFNIANDEQVKEYIIAKKLENF
jgi:hypothetical protein